MRSVTTATNSRPASKPSFRRHARVTVVGDGVFIQDLGSTNGTLVGIHTVRGPKTGSGWGRGRARASHDAQVDVFGRARGRPSPFGARPGDERRCDSRGQPRLPSGSTPDVSRYARRHRCPLALVTFRANDLPGSADEDTVDSTMGALAVTIHVATRGEDILARSARDTFIVLLRADAQPSRSHGQARARGSSSSTISGAPGTTASQTVSCMVAQLGKTALAMPTKVIKWATRAFSHAEDAAQNPIIRLPDLESPSSFPVPDDR